MSNNADSQLRSPQWHQNIEIKLRIKNIEKLASKVALLAQEGPIHLFQDDVFFWCKFGRLKLRVSSTDKSELIYYHRADQTGPRESFYLRSSVSDPTTLRELLAKAYGEMGRVQKHRILFMIGRTRIHLDQVKDLGNFLEIEVVLGKGESPKAGFDEMNEIMKALEIDSSECIQCAYVDLIEKYKNP